MSGINIKLRTGGLTQVGADVYGYCHLSIQYRGADTIPTEIVANKKAYRLTSLNDLITLAPIYKKPLTYSDMLTAYHVRSFFDKNPSGLLYITLYDKDKTDSDIAEGFTEVATNNDVGGNNSIQLFGVNSLSKTSTTSVGIFNTKINSMLLSNSPAYCVYTGYLDKADTLPDFSTLDNYFVGVDVCQDFTEGSNGFDIYKKGWEQATGVDINQCGATGLLLGAIGAIPVHQNIGWTQLGSLTGIGGGWANAGFSNGDLCSSSNSLNDTYTTQGLLYVRLYNNNSGVFFGNFRSACSDTHDYRTGNILRVANKAISVAQKALFTYINSPVYSEASTGLLGQENAAPIQEAVQRALDASMIQGKTGNDIEASAVSTYVDPSQNVLATHLVTCDVTIVPVGSAESITLSVGVSNTIQ